MRASMLFPLALLVSISLAVASSPPAPPYHEQIDYRDSTIMAIAPLGGDSLLLCTKSQLVVWNGTEFRRDLRSSQMVVGSNGLWLLFRDSRSRLWVSSWDTLYGFVGDEVRRIPMRYGAKFILEDKSGRLWVVGSQSNANTIRIIEADGKSDRWLTGYGSSYLEKLHLDSAGNVVLSHGNALVRLHPDGTEDTIPDVPNPSVGAERAVTTDHIHVESDGSILSVGHLSFGPTSLLLHRYKDGAWMSLASPQVNRSIYTALDPTGALHLLYDSLWLRYDGVRIDTLDKIRRDQKFTNTRLFFATTNGRVVADGRRGIHVYNPGSDRARHIPTFEPGYLGEIETIYGSIPPIVTEDKAGRVWIGSTAGVSRLDERGWTVDSIGRVINITADSSGDVWFAATKGLFRSRAGSMPSQVVSAASARAGRGPIQTTQGSVSTIYFPSGNSYVMVARRGDEETVDTLRDTSGRKIGMNQYLLCPDGEFIVAGHVSLNQFGTNTLYGMWKGIGSRPWKLLGSVGQNPTLVRCDEQGEVVYTESGLLRRLHGDGSITTLPSAQLGGFWQFFGGTLSPDGKSTFLGSNGAAWLGNDDTMRIWPGWDSIGFAARGIPLAEIQLDPHPRLGGLWVRSRHSIQTMPAPWDESVSIAPRGEVSKPGSRSLVRTGSAIVWRGTSNAKLSIVDARGQKLSSTDVAVGDRIELPAGKGLILVSAHGDNGEFETLRAFLP
ncbi:MAG: hypothetical protein AAB214_12200 [Fibrobacterota bacterium]